MICAEKGNRVRQIEESEIQKYVEQGYTITDGKGTVIKETVPTDLNSLKLAYVQHINEIAVLKGKIDILAKELENAKKAASKVKSEKVEKSDEETVASPSTTGTRKRTTKSEK